MYTARSDRVHMGYRSPYAHKFLISNGFNPEEQSPKKNYQKEPYYSHLRKSFTFPIISLTSYFAQFFSGYLHTTPNNRVFENF